MSSTVHADLRYTNSHEWVRRNADGSVTIGITDHAQHALGDLVFAETPEAGRTVAAGEACAVVESVKAASDVYSPLAGTVRSGNAALADAPEKINSEPYGAGWLFELLPAEPKAIDPVVPMVISSATVLRLPNPTSFRRPRGFGVVLDTSSAGRTRGGVVRGRDAPTPPTPWGGGSRRDGIGSGGWLPTGA